MAILSHAGHSGRAGRAWFPGIHRLDGLALAFGAPDLRRRAEASRGHAQRKEQLTSGRLGEVMIQRDMLDNFYLHLIVPDFSSVSQL